MLKQFIACLNDTERYQFFMNTVVSDWEEPELDSVGAILGQNTKEIKEMSAKYTLVRKALENRVNHAA